MLLPFEKIPPTMAELKNKNSKWRTQYYLLTSADQLNQFIADMQDVANNPNKYKISEFHVDSQVDGSPFVMVRYYDDEKLDAVKEKKITVWGKLFTVSEFSDLDYILNQHDRTKLFLLAEKRLSFKTGDFFILLIWATVDKPTKFTEGLDVLRTRFINAFSK